MDSEQLRYFISAAQSLNFSEAARKHYITQPAISHHINDLEQQLGVKLFLRVGRQVFLTSEGELFLRESIDILEKVQDSVLKVQRHSEGKSGKLSIGIVNTSNDAFVACLSAFSKQYPNILVDVHMTTGIDQSISINEGRYDFNFTTAQMVLGNGIFDHTVSHQDRFCLALPCDHPLLGKPLDFRELSDERFVMINLADAPLLHTQILEICSQRSYVPKIVNYYNRAEALLLSVGAGVGITILPEKLVCPCSVRNIRYIPIPGDDCLLTSVIAWKVHTTNSAALKFRDVVLELYPQKEDAQEDHVTGSSK
jgi:DNA-binding transcriptional LysR family regulator